MDFSRVELSEDDTAFQTELREFLARIVTDEVIRHDRETGENFDEGVHLALGEAGYLAADFTAGPTVDSPGPQAHLGTRDRPRPHPLVPLGHHRHGGAHGDPVRHDGTA